jgi:hypothetical protein
METSVEFCHQILTTDVRVIADFNLSLYMELFRMQQNIICAMLTKFHAICDVKRRGVVCSIPPEDW